MCFRKKTYDNDLTTGNTPAERKTELRKTEHRQQRHRRHHRRDDDTLRDVATTMPEYDAEKEAAGLLKKIEEILKREAELQPDCESKSQASRTQGEAASSK